MDIRRCTATSRNQAESSKAVVLKRGARPSPGRRQEICALQHGKALNGNVSLPNVTPMLILRRYMLFGLVPADMEVGVKFLEILQAEFEPAYKHLGAQIGRVLNRHAKSV